MKKYLKENAKTILLMIVVFIVCSFIKTTATNYLFASDEVSYDNTNSQLQSNNVQGAIDELYACASDYSSIESRLTTVENNLLSIDDIYPVGSIYISTTEDTAAKVKSKFGGTWAAFGTGRTLVGVNTSDTSFDTVEETGGEKEISYTPAGTNSGGAVQSHTLKTSEIPAHTHGNKSLTGSVSAWTDTGIIGSTVTPSGIFSKGTKFSSYGPGYVSGKVSYGLKIDASHEHSSVGGGGGHTHGFTQPTFTGTASSISTIQPYITVYMWKRTA